MQFIPVPFSPEGEHRLNVEGHSLVMPAVTDRYVGQLSCDVLVCTFGFEKIGYLDCPFVIPIVGNDSVSPSNLGRITLGMEVFLHREKKVVLVQQRAPVLKKYKQAYVSGLLEWVKASQIQQVFLLISVDASSRIESQLSGPQVRYNSVDNSFQSSLPNWLQLEQPSIRSIFRKETLLHEFQEQFKSSNVPLVNLILFCFEGDNSVEATELSKCLNDYFGFSNGSDVSWKFPFFYERGQGNMDIQADYHM